MLGPVGGAAGTAAEDPAGWAWFDALAADLEAASYAVAAADLPAAGIGAPHIRQRLFYGAVALEPVGLGDSLGAGSQGWIGMPGGADQRAPRSAGLAGRLADGNGGLARDGSVQRGGQHRCKPQDSEAGGLVEGVAPAGTDATNGVWLDPDWLLCRDGCWRPVEPGAFPLADGICPRRQGHPLQPARRHRRLWRVQPAQKRCQNSGRPTQFYSICCDAAIANAAS